MANRDRQSLGDYADTPEEDCWLTSLLATSLFPAAGSDAEGGRGLTPAAAAVTDAGTRAKTRPETIRLMSNDVLWPRLHVTLLTEEHSPGTIFDTY